MFFERFENHKFCFRLIKKKEKKKAFTSQTTILNNSTQFQHSGFTVDSPALNKTNLYHLQK